MSHLKPSADRNAVLIDLNHEVIFSAVVVLMQVLWADLVVHDVQRVKHIKPQLPEVEMGRGLTESAVNILLLLSDYIYIFLQGVHVLIFSYRSEAYIKSHWFSWEIMMLFTQYRK
jgi:hypothetical protein